MVILLCGGNSTGGHIRPLVGIGPEEERCPLLNHLRQGSCPVPRTRLRAGGREGGNRPRGLCTDQTASVEADPTPWKTLTLP